MIIKQATQENEEDCVAMSMSFMQMTPYSKHPLDYESLAIMFRNAVDCELAFVAEVEGLVIGMIIGVRVPAFFNNGIMIAQEFGWWVDEEYRHTHAGVALHKAFEEASRDCNIVSMSLLSTSPPQLHGYLKSIGYNEAEMAYFKEN